MPIALYIKKSDTEATKLVEVCDYTYEVSSTGWYRLASTATSNSICEVHISSGSQEVRFLASSESLVKQFSTGTSPVPTVRLITSGSDGSIDIYVDTTEKISLTVRVTNNSNFTFVSALESNPAIPDGSTSYTVSTSVNEVSKADIANKLIIGTDATILEPMTTSDVDTCLQ